LNPHTIRTGLGSTLCFQGGIKTFWGVSKTKEG